MKRDRRPGSLPQLIETALDYAEGLLTDRSQFGLPGQRVTVGDRQIEVNEFIKSEIERYVETWLLPPLRQAMKKVDKRNGRLD